MTPGFVKMLTLRRTSLLYIDRFINNMANIRKLKCHTIFWVLERCFKIDASIDTLSGE